MTATPENDGIAPVEPDIDQNGVDRAQIRAMLALTPSERLRRMQEFVESVLRIREANAERPIR